MLKTRSQSKDTVGSQIRTGNYTPELNKVWFENLGAPKNCFWKE